MTLTADHPVRAGGKWIPARKVKPGDRLLSRGGIPSVVTAVSSTSSEVVVHNLCLDAPHNFAISKARFLVHNNDCRKPKTTYQLDPKNDLDWRGRGRTLEEALQEAFKRTGVPRSQFQGSDFAYSKDKFRDKYYPMKSALGKSIVAEWTAPNGAQVNIDFAHTRSGPGVPHVGYTRPPAGGKKKGDPGHILLDSVPYARLPLHAKKRSGR